MASNFENVLQKVNNFVTLDTDDRRSYTRDFNEIARYLRRRMRELDPVFDQLYAGDCLGGSYADGLKVTKPNEFDLYFQLQLPCQNLANIEVISNMPGHIKINIQKILNEIRPQKNLEHVYKRLLKMVDENENLVLKKVQSWMEGIMTRALRVDRSSLNCEIKYRKTGPAHTLYILQTLEFSIDFVPALVFDANSWIAMHPCPSNVTNQIWHAVPKPLYDRRNVAWTTSYSNFERELVNQKANLKNVLKLMKKMRDRQNINNLKSYYIKTLFLLETEKVRKDFWNYSTSKIFIHMFQRLLFYLKRKTLPFFWDRRFNMFTKLSQNALKTMYYQLKAVYNFIIRHKVRAPKEIYEKFLDEDEMEAMSEGLDLTEQTMALYKEWWMRN